MLTAVWDPCMRKQGGIRLLICPDSVPRAMKLSESVTVVVLTMHALSYCSCTSKIGILVLRLFLSEGTEPTLWEQQ